MKVVIII